MLIGNLQVVEDVSEPITLHFKDTAFKNCYIIEITDDYFVAKWTDNNGVIYIHKILLNWCDCIVSTHKSNLLVITKRYEEI